MNNGDAIFCKLRFFDMALIVQKFGGSSVADISRISNVAQIIKKTKEQGHEVVVVVSAMFGETDRLIRLSTEASKKKNLREYDALLATGEQISAAITAIKLTDLGCPARSYNANQVQILTDANHSKANIIEVNARRLKADIKEGVIPVVAGFQGITIDGDFTTIGRGGSDITAVMLAAVLHAKECQIFTDVDGVYTSDPRIVSDAKKIAQISFEEMWHLAELGAKVLQKNSVKLADRYQIPIRVLSSFETGLGTLVTPQVAEEQPILSGIAFDRYQTKLTLSGFPKKKEIIDNFINSINEAAIDIDMLVQISSPNSIYLDFCFTVHQNDCDQVLSISKKEYNKIDNSKISIDNSIAKLSLVGVGMKSHAGMASKVVEVLTQQGIGIQLITSSESKVSTIIAEQDLERGACLLHSAFDFNH